MTQIGEDLKRLVSTRGQDFVLQCGERRIEDRRVAGALLLSKVRMMARNKTADEVTLGTLGGFTLAYSGGPTWRLVFEATLFIRRTGFDHQVEMEDDLTPLGLIARIERLLEKMPQELRDEERKAEEAEHRLLGYQDRVGQPFAMQSELDAKLAELEALEADLAATSMQVQAKAA
jgi:hypothetical protein